MKVVYLHESGTWKLYLAIPCIFGVDFTIFKNFLESFINQLLLLSLSSTLSA
jgi:hypothetical protein